jgi:hypothetical protein
MKETPAVGMSLRQLGPKPLYKPFKLRSFAIPISASNVPLYTTLPFNAPTYTKESNPKVSA